MPKKDQLFRRLNISEFQKKILVCLFDTVLVSKDWQSFESVMVTLPTIYNISLCARIYLSMKSVVICTNTMGRVTLLPAGNTCLTILSLTGST